MSVVLHQYYILSDIIPASFSFISLFFAGSQLTLMMCLLQIYFQVGP